MFIKSPSVRGAFFSMTGEILALSVPDFEDWDNLSESETREPLAEVMEINDFAGFVVNFISLAGKAIRLPKASLPAESPRKSS